MNTLFVWLKTSGVSEIRKLFFIFIYFWVLFTLFSLHKALVLHDQYVIFHQGFDLINALALAKVVLLGEELHLGDRLGNRPLVYPIIFKSAVFAAILFCSHVVEEAAIGAWNGKTLSQSIQDFGGGTLQGMFIVALIMFVALIPFFAYRELERVIGAEEFSSLLFGRKSNSGADPISQSKPKET